MRILLIDESPASAADFHVLLGASGIQLSTLDHATAAAEGIRLMARDAHDCYVVAHRAGGERGLGVIEAACKAGTAGPVIVLCDTEDPVADATSERAGAGGLLVRGTFTPRMLGRAIRLAVRNAAAVSAARQAESRFRLAQEAAAIGTWDWDIPAGTSTWSPRNFAIFGLAPSQDGRVPHDAWHRVVHPEDRDAAMAHADGAMAGRHQLDSLFRIVRQDPADPAASGATRWISAKGEVVRDAAGTPVRMVGVSVDVTDQQAALESLRASCKRAAAGLWDSEARFRTYFEAAEDCMFHIRVEPDGRLTYEAANPVALASNGMTAETVRGKTPEEVLDPERGRVMTEALRRVCETGQAYRYEPTWETANGPVTYDSVYMPLRDATGAITGILGIARNITERRRLEAALHQAQKMEALGQLAGGVAHDFNNLLTGILGCFDLLAKQVASDAGARLIVQGRRAVERGAALTGRLLAFSRQQPMETLPIDINASLAEVSEMLGRTIGIGIRFGLQLAPDLWLAAADRNQVELAVLNLAINARDAMPLGGTLTVETRNRNLAKADGDLPQGDYVTISVSDTGTGMTPAVMERVLEPFFTTKEAGRGTGLGLSMVYGVMRQMGGDLRIASQPGSGTCVTLFLPRASSAAPAVAGAARSPGLETASILLVDDDPSTQAVISAYATECGHGVILTQDAARALDVLRSGRRADVLLADATMPGLSWAAFIAEARALRPDLLVLLLSGQVGMSGHHTRLDGIPVLAKPFGRAAFNQALARLLGTPARAEMVPLQPEGADANSGGC